LLSQYCFVETGVLINLPGINPFSSSVFVFCTASFSWISFPVGMAFLGVSGATNSLSSAFASSGVKAFLLLHVYLQELYQ